MTTTETGRKAEAAASVYLEMRGFEIIERNFRRPYCEIDIVARKAETIHFIEVKYRLDDQQGGGLEVITASKLRKMERGALVWAEEYKWRGEYVLSAVEVSGNKFMITGFIENVF